jgi:hypothetical protein
MSFARHPISCEGLYSISRSKRLVFSSKKAGFVANQLRDAYRSRLQVPKSKVTRTPTAGFSRRSCNLKNAISTLSRGDIRPDDEPVDGNWLGVGEIQSRSAIVRLARA